MIEDDQGISGDLISILFLIFVSAWWLFNLILRLNSEAE